MQGSPQSQLGSGRDLLQPLKANFSQMSPDHRPRRMVPALGTAAAQTAHQQLNAWSAAAGQEPGSRWQMLVPSTRRYYAQRVEARGRSVD